MSNVDLLRPRFRSSSAWCRTSGPAVAIDVACSETDSEGGENGRAMPTKSAVDLNLSQFACARCLASREFDLTDDRLHEGRHHERAQGLAEDASNHVVNDSITKPPFTTVQPARKTLRSKPQAGKDRRRDPRDHERLHSSWRQRVHTHLVLARFRS